MTVSWGDLACEQNRLFRFLAGRFGLRKGILLQGAAEAGLVVFVSLVLHPAPFAAAVSVVSSVFAIAHIAAWHSNKGFVREMRYRDSQP